MNRKCSEENCGNDVYDKGVCFSHYKCPNCKKNGNDSLDNSIYYKLGICRSCFICKECKENAMINTKLNPFTIDTCTSCAKCKLCRLYKIPQNGIIYRGKLCTCEKFEHIG